MAIDLDKAVLAVDGGGTSCRIALQDGGARHVVTLGPANVATDLSGAIATIREGIARLAAEVDAGPETLCGLPAYLGLAGILDDEDAERVRSALPLALAAVAYNAYYFDAPFDFGQLAAGERVAKFKTGSADVWQTPFWLGAAGLLFSPSRGMLIYSPILVAAFAGAVLVWRDARYREMRWLTLAVIALWTPAFLWFDWWGGWAYGYRPLVDSVPLLAVLCLPALASLFDRPVWRAVFVPLLAWSVLVQGLGAFAYSPWGWNVKVIDSQGNRANVDLPEYRDRLWSFRDWQIAYLIANFQQARAERAVPVRF